MMLYVGITISIFNDFHADLKFKSSQAEMAEPIDSLIQRFGRVNRNHPENVICPLYVYSVETHIYVKI